jgi:hypothetical protein
MGLNFIQTKSFLDFPQRCQGAAVTATFLKCGGFLMLNGRENLWTSNCRERFLAGKMAVIWPFKKLAQKTNIQEQVGYNSCGIFRKNEVFLCTSL